MSKIEAINAEREKTRLANMSAVFSILTGCGIVSPVSSVKISAYENVDTKELAAKLSERFGYEITEADVLFSTPDQLVDLVHRHHLVETIAVEVEEQEELELQALIAEESAEQAAEVEETAETPVEPVVEPTPIVAEAVMPAFSATGEATQEPVAEVNEDLSDNDLDSTDDVIEDDDSEEDEDDFDDTDEEDEDPESV